MPRLLLLAGALVLLASPTRAQTCTTSWTSASSGVWSEAGNWTNGVPVASSAACITASGTYTVTLDQDQALNELVVGGASGTQTLVLGGTLTSLGSGTIGPNGRVENTSSSPCGSCDGLPLITGTLTLEGVLVHVQQTGLLSAGGTLDVAPGGRLVIDAAGTGVNVGQGGTSVLRVRGRVEVTPSAAPQNTNLNGSLEVDGGTIAVDEGTVFVNGEGTLRDATFDVAEGTTLGLRNGSNASGIYVAEGTMQGDVQGTIEFFTNAELQAGASDPQLDMQGNGLLFRGGSGGSVRLGSAGGSFLNTGLVRIRANGAFVRGVVLRNQGTLNIENTSAVLREGAEIHNDAGGTFELVNGGGVRTDDDTGRIENAGLLVSRLEGQTTGSSSVTVPVETDEGEIRVESGRLTIDGTHVFRNATLAADVGATLTINGEGREGPKTVIEGTLSGDIAGDLGFFDIALEAAPGGATLDVTGTGLQLLSGSFGRRVDFYGSGGVFTNVGLVRADVFGTIRTARFINRGTLRVPGRVEIESAGRLRNEGDGLLDLVQGGSIRGDGLLDNHSLITVRREMPTGFSRSSFDETLRSHPGSELRVLKGARIQLDAPGSATLPSGALLTGDGEVFVPNIDFAIEGTVSPGTDAAPIDTLSLTFALDFSRLAGSPQLVVDVDGGGISDRIESASTRAFKPYGALVVRVREGYTPQLGDAFTIWQGQRADQLEGTFTQVVSDGVPTGLAFVAEPNSDASALLLRVVEVAPGGAIAVSETEPLGGGPRSIFLSGPGAPDVTAARLECTECLDADEPVTVELVGEGTVREARMDLTSPRLYGFYELVLERGALPDTTVDVTVRPYLSYIVLRNLVNRGIGVRPAALRYNWSTMHAWNLTNGDAPGYTVTAIDREDEEQVSLALAGSNPFAGSRIFAERKPEDGPQGPILAFGRIEPNRSIYLTYGQRILPEDVLFPEQTPTGPDDDRIPFGEDRIVYGLAANHASFARMRDLIADALETTDDNALAVYLLAVETADPGAVGRGIAQTIDRNKGYVEGTNGLFERILDELDASSPVPSGLKTSAYPAFRAALDGATGRYMVASYEAINLDSQAAPASVGGLLDAEVADLEGRGPNPSQRVGPEPSHPGGGSLCKAPPINQLKDKFGDSLGNVSLSEGDGGADLSLRATAFALNQAQALNQHQQTMTAAHDASHALQQSCRNMNNITLGNRWGAGHPPPGTCPPPPPPPGGSAAGGGGACSPPSAPADPNDKTANSQFPCEIGTVTVDGEEVTRCIRYYVPREEATSPIVYSVQFENLPQATANAEFVTITDELDANLDPSTLTVIGTSADSVFTYDVVGQTATFRFVGIDLPPNVEQPEGQGFVSFSVEPRDGLADGTEIRNDASIVFDFNPAIETPEVVHEIREMSDLAVTVLSPDFELPDQPVDVEVFVSNLQGDDAEAVTLTLALPAAASSISVPDGGKCTGTTTLTCTLGALAAGEFTTVTLELPPSPIGNYTITADASSSTFDGFLPNNREQVGLPIVEVSAEDDPARQLALAVGPNPTRGTVTLWWTLPQTADVELAVFDLLGREVAQLDRIEKAPASAYVSAWDAEVAAGVYVVRLRAGEEVRTRRVTVLR